MVEVSIFYNSSGSSADTDGEAFGNMLCYSCLVFKNIFLAFTRLWKYLILKRGSLHQSSIFRNRSSHLSQTLF